MQTHDSKPLVWHRGPVIIAVESLFFDIWKYPSHRAIKKTPPWSEKAFPREVEDPYRIGEARLFRIPLTRRALMVGFWLPAGSVLPEEEDAHLLAALEGRMLSIPARDIADWVPRPHVALWHRLLGWLRKMRHSFDYPDYDKNEYLTPEETKIVTR